MKSRVARIATKATALATIAWSLSVGLIAAIPAPAQAAGCQMGTATQFRVFNYNCTWGQHIQYVGSSVIYAPRVGPQSWSVDTFCSQYQTGFGKRSSGIKTNAV